VDAADEDDKENAQNSASAAASAAMIPPSLKRSKETVMTVLTQPVHASQFRLDALTASVLDPLQELLGQKRYFLSDTQVSSLDCLALGYLALFLYPNLPQSWLADTMRRKYAKLCGRVDDLRGRFFGCPIPTYDPRAANQETNTQEQEDVGTAHHAVLPWAAAESGGVFQNGSLLLENVMDTLPLNYIPKASRTSGVTSNTQATNPESTTPHPGLNSQVLAITAGASAMLGYLLYAGFSPGEEQKKTSSLRDLGEAGAILSGIADYSATGQGHPSPQDRSSSE
jgi:sorting and assembly machinery component 37